ncbi:hypothetical protein O3P69_013636 [Scylla paramamosain]|uniref:Uncharacterized protein n=1 Tax=Scylla paramamosain TaxID=85552 RepID=A0AAW0SP74_SCYPA
MRKQGSAEPGRLNGGCGCRFKLPPQLSGSAHVRPQGWRRRHLGGLVSHGFTNYPSLSSHFENHRHILYLLLVK